MKGRITVTSESPLLRVGLPRVGLPMMNVRRERAAIAAMQLVNGKPTHRLPNGLGFIAPYTGVIHGPRMENGALDSTCAGIPWAS